MPSDKRYELIDGEFHMVPAPLTYHQKISLNLLLFLADFVRRSGSGEVLAAPVDVVLSEEDVIQPDILFISKERLGILTEKNIEGAPDLVIEILSPSSKKWDLEIKMKLYEKYGVREYWIADPEAKSIRIFTLTEAGFQLAHTCPSPLTLSSPLLKGLKIPLEQVFV